MARLVYLLVALSLIVVATEADHMTTSQPVESTPNCIRELSNGPDPDINRPFVDADGIWTFVWDTEFPQHGLLTEVRFFAKAANRSLDIGIYRPEGQECNYTLINQYRLDASQIQEEGYIELSIPNDQWMVVQPGDHFGFAWVNGGVIAFSETSSNLYCTYNGLFMEGETKSIGRDYAKRIYSVSVLYTNCFSTPEPPSTTPVIDECTNCCEVPEDRGEEFNQCMLTCLQS